MKIDKFRELVDANPFVLLTLHLTDGRSIPVVHPEYVAFAPSGRIVSVFHGEHDASSFVDIMFVPALELNPGEVSAQSA